MKGTFKSIRLVELQGRLIKENLKQGTILAAPICANHIDKGMQVVKKENLGINFGNILIRPLLYQDDILIASISHKKCRKC